MGKYNITEKKEKEAAYRSLVSPRMMDEMQEKILNIIVMQKKYRDKDYSAKKRYQGLRMEEVSDMVGFANRQSFYASFFRVVGVTPREYRMQHLKQHPAMQAKRLGRKPKP